MVDFRTFQLTIEATDNGAQPRASTTILNVSVNQTIPFREFRSRLITEEESLLSSFNLILVIGMVVGCAVVVVALSAAIVVVRHRDRHRRHDRKYNCRMEALKMLTNKDGGVTGEGAPVRNGCAVHGSTADNFSEVSRAGVCFNWLLCCVGLYEQLAAIPTFVWEWNFKPLEYLQKLYPLRRYYHPDTCY